MILPIKNAKDLSEQTNIKYGTLLGGSTYEFFRVIRKEMELEKVKLLMQSNYIFQRSEVPVYKRMFEFMSGPQSLNVKSYSDGIKLVREMKGLWK